jgi:hypothetical protein
MYLVGGGTEDFNKSVLGHFYPIKRKRVGTTEI